MPETVQLVAFDMEGTLTDDPTLWEIMHLKNGTWESHGLRYWERFKAGDIHYDAFARMDVAAWEGAPVALLDEAIGEVPLMPGCVELLDFLRDRGIPIVIISNGLKCLGDRLARDHGVARVAANREVRREGRLTGEMELCVPYDAKGRTLLALAAEMNVPPEAVLAVGDGAADVGMFEVAGRSVAFCASDDRVAGAADVALGKRDLTQLIPLFQ